MKTHTAAEPPAGASRHVDPDRVDARFVDTIGELRQTSWSRAAQDVALEQRGPIRRFPVRHGRRVAPGWWWSATTGHLVHNGFGAMRTQLMLPDRDPTVVGLACSPVEPTWAAGPGSALTHTPHPMARFKDGNAALIDCSGSGHVCGRLARVPRPMTAAARAVGWHYRTLGTPDTMMVANVRRPAGYRHPRHASGVPTNEVRACFARPRPLVEGVRALGDPIAMWPVVFHALWHEALSVPLDQPLHERVLVVATASQGKRR